MKAEGYGKEEQHSNVAHDKVDAAKKRDII